MRVTNKMMVERVAYNSQAALSRFLEMQTQMSSGKRINKPSDDPLGVLRDLDYRSELAKNDQFIKNVSRGLEWMQNYDSILGDTNNLISAIREISVVMANEVADDDGTSRKAAAVEVRQMFEQIIELANTEIEDKFVFSGFRTDARAIIASSNGARYMGDSGRIKFQVDSSTDMIINSVGAEVFLDELSILGAEADLNVAVKPDTLLADLHNGAGVDLTSPFEIVDRNLGITVTVDLSAAVTVQDALDAINAALVAGGITNLTASIGIENNNILMDSTENGLISTVTMLDVINGGAGIDLTNGKIRVTDHATIDVTIDFGGCQTIGDIIDAFNTQAAAAGLANVNMEINATSTGLNIVDSNGVSLGLSVEEVDNFTTVAGSLGINGEIDPVLEGDDLNPTVSFLVQDLLGTLAVDLGIAGEFFADSPGSDLDPLLLATANLTDLNNATGYELGEVEIWQGEMSCVIDFSSPSIITIQDLLDAINNSGLDITASINPDGRGIQIVNNDPYRSLTVEDVGESDTTKRFGIYGSSDMLGSCIVLMNALENDDQEGVGLLLGNFETAIDKLLNHRSNVGVKAIRLETTKSRLLDRELTFTRRLSEIEDADMTELITQLSVYENNYQAALLATAKIIQPSLLDFLS